MLSFVYEELNMQISYRECVAVYMWSIAKEVEQFLSRTIEWYNFLEQSEKLQCCWILLLVRRVICIGLFGLVLSRVGHGCIRWCIHQRYKNIIDSICYSIWSYTGLVISSLAATQEESSLQHQAENKQTIHLASLNADVLFHLIKFVDPVARFNLILSGILKGFENVSKGINVEHEY
jgi:hypothetical protein